VLVAQHLFGLKTLQQATAYEGAQDTFAQSRLRLGYGIRIHAGGGVEDDARWFLATRHFLKHPIDCADMEVNVFVQG
jgi:hypothetical protein